MNVSGSTFLLFSFACFWASQKWYQIVTSFLRLAFFFSPSTLYFEDYPFCCRSYRSIFSLLHNNFIVQKKTTNYSFFCQWTSELFPFFFSVIKNSAAINALLTIPWYTYVRGSLRYILKRRIAGSWGIITFNLINIKLFSKMVVYPFTCY